MKTLKFFIGFSILVATFFIISCEKETNEKTSKLNVTDFKKIGVIHNDFLTNVKDNFTISDNIKTEQEKIEAINQFNKNFVNSTNLNSDEKEKLLIGLEKNKNLVKKSYLVSKAFGNIYTSRTNDDNEQNIFEMIDTLFNEGVISNETYQILNSLANDLKNNYEGMLSDAQLKINIESLINDYNNVGYQAGSDGEMLGTILAISISSIEWWEQNPDASNIPNVRLAPWLAADIVGAVWGGATGAIGSYVGSGEVNWGSVGIGALSGAVAGSTGAIGRIARLL